MTAEPASSIRVRRLGPSFDLLGAYPGHGGSYIEREGRGVAGTLGADGDLISGRSDEPGIRRLASETIDRLRAFGVDGPNPAAVGAVGFDADREAVLQIPGRSVRRGFDGRTWLFSLGPGLTDNGALPVMPRPPRDAFSAVQIQEYPTPDVYREGVARALDEIGAGALRKVVLARTIEVEAGRELDPRRLLHHLRAVEPDAYSFAVPSGPGASLVGASPELLVSRQGLRVASNPLAGSAPRSGDREEDLERARMLVASGKDRAEHALVVEAMAQILGPLCTEIAWDPEPVLHETANVWHLSTRFRGTLREPAPSVLELVALLHPTPAVCGDPAFEALELIRELEPFGRGIYAGAVGWIDAAGDGEWAIALRCAELARSRATLFAGAGIVADSVPEREVDETQSKFRAFLDALRWG